MRKKKIVVANWKMNPSCDKDADKLFSAIAKNINFKLKAEVVVCPPYLYLGNLKNISLGRSRTGEAKKISLGAQNTFCESKGAFTGEISAPMLSDAGVKYVIVGHSERRAQGEDNSGINKKLKASISFSLLPILCVGETVRDEKHDYFNIVKNQIEECMKGIQKSLISKIIIAYEPVWAISSTIGRRDATPADSLEMVIFIRKVLSDLSSPRIASETRILYGGSVDNRDAGGFIESGGVDGLLVGRASLDPKKFSEIVRIVNNI